MSSASVTLSHQGALVNISLTTVAPGTVAKYTCTHGHRMEAEEGGVIDEIEAERVCHMGQWQPPKVKASCQEAEQVNVKKCDHSLIC